MTLVRLLLLPQQIRSSPCSSTTATATATAAVTKLESWLVPLRYDDAAAAAAARSKRQTCTGDDDDDSARAARVRLLSTTTTTTTTIPHQNNSRLGGVLLLLPGQWLPPSSLSSSAVSAHRYFHSTAARAMKQPPPPSPEEEEEEEEDDDEVPIWQNPLHHNNPEYQKIFPEDFAEGEEMVPLPLPPFETDPDKTVAPPHVEALAHKIVQLTLLELKELTDKIGEHFGFDDSMLAASYGSSSGNGSGGNAAAAAQEEEAVPEKVTFDLKLVGFDAKAKIKVIKEIRAIAGLGLKEAKELVEAAPKVVQKDLKAEAAEELKVRLEAVGAIMEIV